MRQDLPSYTSDPKQGLERLEREKLDFLKSAHVISKFEPDNIKKYAVHENTPQPVNFSHLESFTALDLALDSDLDRPTLQTPSLGNIRQLTQPTIQEPLPWALNRAIKADDDNIVPLDEEFPFARVLRPVKIFVKKEHIPSQASPKPSALSSRPPSVRENTHNDTPSPLASLSHYIPQAKLEEAPSAPEPSSDGIPESGSLDLIALEDDALDGSDLNALFQDLSLQNQLQEPDFEHTVGQFAPLPSAPQIEPLRNIPQASIVDPYEYTHAQFEHYQELNPIHITGSHPSGEALHTPPLLDLIPLNASQLNSPALHQQNDSLHLSAQKSEPPQITAVSLLEPVQEEDLPYTLEPVHDEELSYTLEPVHPHIAATQAPPQAEAKSILNILWFVAVALLVAGSLFFLYLMGYFTSSSSLEPPSLSAVDKIRSHSPEDIARASRRASEAVHMAFDFQAYLLPALITNAQQSQDPQEALEYWHSAHALFPQSIDALHGLGRALIQSQKYQEARDILRESRDTIAFNEETQTLILQAFRQDPAFLPPDEYIDEPSWDAIAPLGGGSTLTFKIQNDNKTIAAFKPLQTRRQSNYRAEIAAWRLCQLIECDFKVPYNKEIRIEKSAFFTMFNRSKSSKKEDYAPQLVDLIWTKQNGKEYLFGTYKEWIDDFTRFPIELLTLWKPWLAQSETTSPLLELKIALAPIQNISSIHKLYPKILSASPNLTTDQLASQIAQILVFDLLTGNWDRFSGVPQWWGVNCQFANDQIVSIDNGASFQPYTNQKVFERFQMAQKFSKRFIREIHALNKDETLALLFPNPDERERRSFEQFWIQRTVLLSHVDSLVEQYGAERVFAFP